jgi:hypothetical protein
MFEYHQNTLCVRANWLNEVGVISSSYLQNLKSKGKVKRAKHGGGLGGYAWYIYESLPQRFRNVIEHDLQIDPYEQSKVIPFSKFLKYDENAAAFFANYELEDGRFLSEVNESAVEEYTANAIVFNAIKAVHTKVTTANPKINKGELWNRFAISIQSLSNDIKERYPFDVPTNPRALRAKYEACILQKANKRYSKTGLEGLIHDNYCNNNSTKISDEIGDWLMAYKCLPINYSYYELQKLYNEARIEKGWSYLSEGAINNFLTKPENVRIWTLASEGTDAYNKKYAHTLSKDKERLFPNAHWAIDGTKLDTVHYWDTTSKMAAVCKINVIMDVYSEKILGSSFSLTENHVDHFIALRMSVDEAGARPYLFTYDAQSAHKSKRMQELYSKVIAKGGQHYHHKVGRKTGAPIEQMFNRLQQQVVMKRWFSDGQGIKTQQSRSTANLDFVHENRGALPNFEELQKHWEIMVAEWNESVRSKKTTKRRNEFFTTKTKYTQELDTLDRISMFWINETKPKKYYAHGMPLTVAGEDYLFEVYDADGNVDIDFQLKYVQQSLIVSYDPEYLDNYISLYRLNENNEKVFVAYAEKKRRHVEVAILKQPGEHEKMLRDVEVRAKVKAHDWNAYMEIVERTGISREALITEQNNWVANNAEFNAKRAAFASKEENLESDSNSLFDRMLNK